MFERYTASARQAIFFAREEAQKAGSERIQTEHLLLGLLREDASFLAPLLPLTATEAHLRSLISGQSEQRPGLPSNTDTPLSNASKVAMMRAAKESDKLGHKHIGTDHLLLGLLAEEGSFAHQFLKESGADVKSIRKSIAESTNF